MAMGHAGVDFYQGLIPVLVPFLVLDRGLGYSAVSVVVLAGTVASAATQPAFGWLVDRRTLPWILPASMLTCAAGVILLGSSTSFTTTLVAAAMVGLGVAAYHPSAARIARVVTGGGHRAMSWFSLGGNAGFVLAPLAAGPVLSRLGLQATGWLAVPALVGIAVTLPVLSKYKPTATNRSTAKGSDDWSAFGQLTLIVVLRSIAYLGLAGFVGLYAVQRVGGGGGAATAAVFALYAGAAVGTVLGGRFAERWGRLAVVRAGYLATTLLLPVLLLVPGPSLYGAIALVGTALSLPFSLHITLGQDLLPTRPGTASGVTLGLAVSAGGLFAPLIGAVVDRTSLRTGLALLIVFVAAAWLISLRLAPRSTGLSQGGRRRKPPRGDPPASPQRRRSAHSRP